MVGSNKILTVSYGTFSCTLEGFEDSFDTMKAIAEYFRDLAADDRYFGAEPPTPDAEMLARIAEREVARRVEAHQDENGIRLRAAPSPLSALAPAAAAAAVQPAPVEELAEEPVEEPAAGLQEAEAPAAADDELDRDAGVLAAVAAAEEPAEEAVEELAEDAVAEEVEEAVEEVDAEEPAEEAMAEEAVAEEIHEEETAEAPAGIEDTIGAFLSEDSAAEAPEAAESAEEFEAWEDDAGLDAAAGQDEAAEETAEVYEDEDEDEDDVFGLAADEEELSDDEELAAEDEDEDELAAEDAEEAIEDDWEEAWDDDEEDTLDAAEAVIEATAEEATPAAAAAEGGPDLAFEDDYFDFAAPDEAPAAAAAAAVPLADENSVSAKLERIRAVVSKTPEADEGYSEDEHAAAGLDEPAVSDDTIAGVMSSLRSEPGREKPAPRIIRMKRDEYEEALAREADALEDALEEDRYDAGALPEEDEAELMAELAEAEAMGPDGDYDEDYEDTGALDDSDAFEDDDESAAATGAKSAIFAELDADEVAEREDAKIRQLARKTSRMGGEGRIMLEREVAEDEESVSRLLDEADTQLQEPEGNRRRSAIAHLKAAVAATRADRLMGRGRNERDEEQYREDLAEVVRPRRPERPARPETKSERPDLTRQSPLKLVAEQRVDTPEPRQPVMPRRVAAAAAAPEAAEGEGGFAQFAQEQGATELPDLLEAAAAYLALVEGHEQFSRPQVMTKVRQVEQENFSREDGLRSFGQLLRQGKIQKLKGGRFTVSENIGYKPETRFAGE